MLISMVEVSTISFEIQNVEKFFPVFYKNITQEGYSDLHGSLLTHADRLFHDYMKVDFNYVIDTSSKNTGIKILVNQEMKTSVLLESGLRRGRRHEQVMYEISIFSDDIKKNIKGIDFIKDILINKIKIKSVIIDGSQKEFLMHNILGTLKENHRSRLIEQVKKLPRIGPKSEERLTMHVLKCSHDAAGCAPGINAANGSSRRQTTLECHLCHYRAYRSQQCRGRQEY